MTTKKNLNYYLSLPYKLEIIPDSEEGGFAARFPELPGCITCGETLDDVVKNAEDAKREWLLTAIEENREIPKPFQVDTNQYSGQFKLRIPKILHKTLAEHAKLEGISMNQYCMYLLSRNDALHTAR
ncbi:MAG: type II toxin-antitoxin system HicB family antitoxin [Selenomonadaceae bacterium]|nr:type II toxin-antitoxin system HicB family antitoxin [Selenomonadaceae bacterium]